MVSSIASNSTAALANQQQPTDEMKAKVAADTRALPSRVEAEAEKKLAEFEKWQAKFEKNIKLIELNSLQTKKESAIETARLRKDVLLAHYEKMSLATPKPATKLEGAEAQRILQMAEERAKENGSRVPPPKGSTYGFFDGDFLYRVSSDSSITRQHKDVPTPEEHKEYLQIWGEQKSIQARFVVENAAEIADIDKRKADLLSELGLTEDDWQAQANAGGNISFEV